MTADHIAVPADWLKPGAVVPVTPEAVNTLVQALRSVQAPAEAHGVTDDLCTVARHMAGLPPAITMEDGAVYNLGPGVARAIRHAFILAGSKVQPKHTAAEAWAEGYRLGVLDERTSADNIGIAGFGAKVEPARQNPYGDVQAPAPAHEPVARIASFDEYGPLLEWFKHWSTLPAGTQLYASTAKQANTRSPLTSELVAAALMLKKWAEERNEPAGWHIAGIGAVTAQSPAVGAEEARDAARYRWLREMSDTTKVNIDLGAGFEISETLDDAVDEAMRLSQPPVQGSGS